MNSLGLGGNALVLCAHKRLVGIRRLGQISDDRATLDGLFLNNSWPSLCVVCMVTTPEVGSIFEYGAGRSDH